MQPTHHRRFARDLAETVVSRAEYLPPFERSLLLAVYAEGKTVKDLATVTRENPRHLARRIRRLTRRILSNPYIFVVRHRDSWPSLRRRIATACIVHGCPVRAAAAEHNTSLYNARKQLDAVRALLDSINDRPPRAIPDEPRAGHEPRPD